MPDKDLGSKKLSPVTFYYFNLTGHSDTMSGSLFGQAFKAQNGHDHSKDKQSGCESKLQDIAGSRGADQFDDCLNQCSEGDTEHDDMEKALYEDPA